VKTLQDAASLASHERGPVVISTLRANGTIQSSLVNAGVLAHPATGDTVLALVTVGSIKLANLRARPQITATFRRPRHRGPGGPGPTRAPPARNAA
jgi:hypothetical protein